MKIQALHDFHDKAYSEEWGQRFEPTPARLDLFNTILQNITQLNTSSIHILELGIGPGYLAEHLLKNLVDITYQGLDFSEAMIDIASRRNKAFQHRIQFVQVDLISDKNWIKRINHRPHVIVSTWTLHDLFNDQNIFSVFQNVFQLLPEGGLFLNGDFVKPEELDIDYEGGRIKPSAHLQLLQNAGFASAKCLKEFEKNLTNPTTANNYACFRAGK